MPRLRSLIGAAATAAALTAAAPAAASPYDMTFGGGDGIATFSGLGGGTNEHAFAAVVQPDGKTVIAGQADDDSGDVQALVMRLDADGTLDESFGDGGKTVVPFSDSLDRFSDVALAPDGKIVAAGYTSGGVNDDFDTIAARFNTNGTLDSSADSDPATAFSDDGKLAIDLAGGLEDYGEAVLIQGSGKVVIASGVLLADGTNQYDVGLLRLNDDGSPDGTWGPGGLVKTDLGPGAEDGDAPEEMIEQTDDKIVLIGGTDVDTGAPQDFDWAFARYNSDGTLDSGAGTDATPTDEFGTDGITIVHLSDRREFGLAVEVLPDGRIVGVGYARPNSDSDLDAAAVGLTSAGALDTAGFGTTGRTITDLGGGSDRLDGVSIQSDGKIVAAGDGGSTQVVKLLRYTSAGALDPAFDGDGIFSGPATDGNDVVAHGQRITAVGTVFGIGVNDVLAIRINQNDVDSDTVADETDNCLGLANPGQENNDGDSQGDACDTDDDNDGTPDSSDAFPKNGAEAADTDGDGTGNNADTDDDNDGTPDAQDAFPLNAAESVDTDGDGIGNNADPDDDNDTFPDAQDAFPLDHNRWNPDTPVGTNANDVLNGTAASETICGLLGNDRINGAGGNDLLYGDRCKDKTKVDVAIAQAADGKDTLRGGTGNDRLFGAGGNDKLSGEDGNDKLYGGGGNDRLTGGAGNDLLRGDSGRDSYSGGAGTDSIYAQDKTRETVDCGSGSKDVARVDRTDKVKNCETVRRSSK